MLLVNGFLLRILVKAKKELLFVKNSFLFNGLMEP